MKEQIKIHTSIYNIAFVIYFFTLFCEDLLIENTTVLIALKLARYSSYCLFLLSLYSAKRKKREIILFMIILLFSSLLSLLTKDIYFCVISIIILASIKINIKELIEISYTVLLVLTMIIVSLSLLGIIPMNSTMRLGEIRMRYSIGFYHSNVLPMIIFFLLVYRIILKGNDLKKKEIFFWLIVILVVYKYCLSRNGLYGSILLLILYIVGKSPNIKINSIFRIFSKYTIIILNILSVFLVIMQNKGNPLIYYLNQLFSGRYAIAYHQTEVMGIQLISTLDGDEYAKNALVIDNGYLYVILRYGILFLIFYFVIHFLITTKYKNLNYMLVVSIVVSITNMIDNDLFSYGYLPIIIIAFNGIGVLDKSNLGERENIVGRVCNE